jgi:hypothetical protein
MTIVEFLEARIAEDEEREARKFRDRPGALAGYTVTSTSEGKFGVALKGSTERPRFMSSAEYFERFCEPAPDARMLAECAAKRFILTMHETYARVASERTGIAAFGAECGRDVTADVLKPLAAVYKDHPDYDEDWAL